jgi:hypothetical protein
MFSEEVQQSQHKRVVSKPSEPSHQNWLLDLDTFDKNLNE